MRQISLIDFAPLSGTDWYPALREALTYVTALGGGRLHVPSRPAPYACNVTTVIPIASNDIEIELEPGAVLRNTSVSGVDFFQFAGTAGTRQRVNFRGGRIVSEGCAGHVFTFAPGVGLGRADWTSEIVQLNAAKSILIWRGASGSGLFTNRFGGPNWEHGSVSSPPSVPAVDVNNAAAPDDVVDTNVFNENTFAMQRCTCHFGTNPFFSFINDGPSDGAFYSCNKIIGVGTVEQVRNGFIKIAGALNFTVRDIGFYDSKDVDGHMIETTTGDGGAGRACEQCVFMNICVVSVSGDVIGVLGTNLPATFTSSGTTVTVTANGHPWKAGQRVYVAGDITQRATVVDPSLTQFTFVANTTPPESGNLSIYTAAMTIKIGSGDTRHTLQAIGGNRTSTVEVDLNSRDCLFIGDHARVGVYRVAATAKVIGFNGE